MDFKLLFMLGSVVASLSGAWALVRSQVSTLKQVQEEIKQTLKELKREQDIVDNNVSVLRNQIKVLSDILSPSNLERENKWKGGINISISDMQEKMKTLQHMHNGAHPPISKE